MEGGGVGVGGGVRCWGTVICKEVVAIGNGMGTIFLSRWAGGSGCTGRACLRIGDASSGQVGTSELGLGRRNRYGSQSEEVSRDSRLWCFAVPAPLSTPIAALPIKLSTNPTTPQSTKSQRLEANPTVARYSARVGAPLILQRWWSATQRGYA